MAPLNTTNGGGCDGRPPVEPSDPARRVGAKQAEPVVTSPPAPFVAVVGGGPAGLAAAEVLALGGSRVTVFEQMPSVGRKLLLAGRSGLNLTHAEPLEAFLDRYGEARHRLEPSI